MPPCLVWHSPEILHRNHISVGYSHLHNNVGLRLGSCLVQQCQQIMADIQQFLLRWRRLLRGCHSSPEDRPQEMMCYVAPHPAQEEVRKHLQDTQKKFHRHNTKSKLTELPVPPLRTNSGVSVSTAIFLRPGNFFGSGVASLGAARCKQGKHTANLVTLKESSHSWEMCAL